MCCAVSRAPGRALIPTLPCWQGQSPPRPPQRLTAPATACSFPLSSQREPGNPGFVPVAVSGAAELPGQSWPCLLRVWRGSGAPGAVGARPSAQPRLAPALFSEHSLGGSSRLGAAAGASPRGPCPPGHASLRVRSGVEGAAVTLRDAVWLRPSGQPADRLARDEPGFALTELNPHAVMWLPCPRPHCFGDLFEAQVSGSSSSEAALPKPSCICSDEGLVSVRTRSGLAGPGATCRCHFLEPVA